MNRLRIAVVGGGHLGRIHARALRAFDDVEFLGVVEPLAESRERLAAELGVPVYSTLAALDARLQAAVVATPTVSHRDVALPLLARGVHALVEKPLAPGVEEAEELVDAALRAGVVLQVGHVERFNPAWQSARGRLAEPKFVEARRLSGYSFRSSDIGVVLDVMIHDLDLLRSIATAPVVEVQAIGVSVFGHHEDAAQARIAFADGCVATLTASRVSYAPLRSFQVWSASGVTTLDLAARTATAVDLPACLARGELDVDALPPSDKARLKDHLFEELLPLQRTTPPARDAITDELRDFVDSVRQGRAPQVTGHDALGTLRLAERILASIERHRWDGHDQGRIGPLAAPGHRVLRGPHWDRQPSAHPAAEHRREAG